MKTQDLLLLIRSLSKAEKRSLNQQAQKQKGKDTNYLELYKELEKFSETWNPEDGMPETYEQGLKRKLKSQNILTSFQNLKYYLGAAIFKTLRIVSKKSNHRDAIEMGMKEAQILETRGLLEAAADRLNEALDEVQKFEYYALGLEILTSLIRIESQLDSKIYEVNIAKHLATLGQFQTKLAQESKYYGLYIQNFIQFRLAGATLKNDFPVIEKQPGYASFFAEVYHCQALAFQALIHGNIRKAHEHSKDSLHIWKKKKDMKMDRLSTYIKFVSNYLNLCLAQKSYDDDFHQYLNELGELKKKPALSSENKAELEQNIILIKQLYFLNTDQLEKARDLFADFEALLKQYGTKINKAREITIRYNHLVVLMALSDYQRASIDMVDARGHHHRRDLQLLGKIMEIIIHYELKDHQFLDTLVKKLGRLLDNNDTKIDFDFERLMLRNLLKLAEIQISKRQTYHSDEEQAKHTKDAFDKFYSDLNEHQKAMKYNIGFEEVFIWVESKVQQKSFREVLKNRNPPPA